MLYDNFRKYHQGPNFELVVETTPRGERCYRVSTTRTGKVSKPKYSTYSVVCRIANIKGTDKVVVVRLTTFNHINVIEANLRFDVENIFENTSNYEDTFNKLTQN